MAAKYKKRADGRYQLSVMVGYNPDGKPKRKLVYGKTQAEVRDKANELRMLHNMGIELDNDITVADWAETWLNTYKSGVAYRTRKMYDDTIKKYIAGKLGHIKLRDLKAAHLQRIINENNDKPRSMEIFKLTTKQLLDVAMINDLIIKNPASGISLPTKKPSSSKRALTDKETEQVLNLNLDMMDKCYIMLLLYTGMRKGEVLALSKSSICRDTMQISVNNSVFFKTNQSFIKPYPKTQAGVRTIPILQPLRETLFDYLDSIETDLLFPGENGGTMSSTSYRWLMRRFCKAMGTHEITAHIFRHNFATILYNADVDVKTAQAIMGHASIKILMDTYTHLSDKNKDEATDKLNFFLTNSD